MEDLVITDEQKAAYDAHIANIDGNPHGTTAADVGAASEEQVTTAQNTANEAKTIAEAAQASVDSAVAAAAAATTAANAANAAASAATTAANNATTAANDATTTAGDALTVANAAASAASSAAAAASAALSAATAAQATADNALARIPQHWDAETTGDTSTNATLASPAVLLYQDGGDPIERTIASSPLPRRVAIEMMGAVGQQVIGSGEHALYFAVCTIDGVTTEGKPNGQYVQGDADDVFIQPVSWKGGFDIPAGKSAVIGFRWCCRFGSTGLAVYPNSIIPTRFQVSVDTYFP